MKIPNCEQAFVDIVKLQDYCLNAEHLRGRHKARVFRSVLGLTADKLLCALRAKLMLQLLDVVALTEDLPERNLLRGQVGTVVEVLAPDVYEVEFSDNSGRTYAMLALHSDQLMTLHYEPVQKAG